MRCHRQRVLRTHAEPDRIAHDRVDVPVLGDVLRLSVVGAEGHPRRPVLEHERRERAQVPRGRGLPDQEPHPGPQSLQPLLGRGCLVIRADSRRRVGLELAAENAGRVAVDVVGALDGELGELARRARDHAGEVHHLREPDHPAASEQRLQVTGVEWTSRRLEPRRRNARGRGEVDVERQVGARVDEPVDAVGAEDVRDLVRIGDDRGRPEREHQPGELGDEQLRRLEVHVGVDEAGHDVRPVRVDRLLALVRAETRDDAVADRDVDIEPFAGEDREHATAAHDDVGRLVPPRDRQPAGEITLRRH